MESDRRLSKSKSHQHLETFPKMSMDPVDLAGSRSTYRRDKESPVQEAVMARKHTHARGLKPIAAAALAGLGIAVLLGSLDLATAQLSHFLGTAAWGMLGVLPSLVPTVLQALLDYERSLHCPLQMLMSFWPLLAVMASAV